MEPQSKQSAMEQHQKQSSTGDDSNEYNQGSKKGQSDASDEQMDEQRDKNISVGYGTSKNVLIMDEKVQQNSSYTEEATILEKWKHSSSLKIQVIDGEGKVLKKSTWDKPNQKSYNSQKVEIVFDPSSEYFELQNSYEGEITLKVIIQGGFQRSIFYSSFKISKDSIENQSNMVLNDDDTQLSLKITKLTEKPLLHFCRLKYSTQTIINVYETRVRLIGDEKYVKKTIKNIEDIKGIYLQVSQQRLGSHVIQKLLKNCTEEHIKNLFQEFEGHFAQMIKGTYSSFVVEKLVNHCSKQIKHKIVVEIEKQFLSLIQTMQGSLSLTQLIQQQSVLPETYNLIAQKYLKNAPLEIYTNKYSGHFLLRFLTSSQNLSFINQMIQVISRIYTDRYGVLLIHKLIDFIGDCSDNLVRVWLVKKVESNLNKLMIDEYGHFVVEKVLERFNENEVESYLRFIIFYIAPISISIHALGVVKKALEVYKEVIHSIYYFFQRLAAPIIYRIINSGEVREFMEYNSGSFLLQQLLEHSSRKRRDDLVESLIGNVENVVDDDQRNKWNEFFQR